MSTEMTHGKPAPLFMLPDRDGLPFVLKESLDHGPVLLAFLSDECPASETVMTYLERMQTLYKADEGFADEMFQLIGVSQDGMPSDDDYSHPPSSVRVAVDTDDYDVSNLYDIQVIPTLVLIETDGRVALRSEGFVRRDFERVSKMWAETIDFIPREVFKHGESVPNRIEGCESKNVVARD